MWKIGLLLASMALIVLLSSTAAVLTAEPSAGQTSAVTLVGAGDISRCDSAGDTATAELVDSISGTVFTAGDNAYKEGTQYQFNNCYDPTWGRVKARTKPAVGNHEYRTPEASGYFTYFDAAAGEPGKGYYSYNRGAWHIIVLNSECEHLQGGCEPTSPMLTWLKNDLAAHPTRCTLAYFHKPLFSSGYSRGNPEVRPLWNALYAAHADAVVSGHDHVYERFARQTPSGALDERGIREFVVGTGGADHGGFNTRQPHSQVRNAKTYGVLKLRLQSAGYSWRFVPVSGKTFTDSGFNYCH